MRSVYLSIVALAFIATALTAPAFSQSVGVAEGIWFQGYLTDDGGVPINALTDIDLVLWDSLTGGNQIWYRYYSDVPVVNGLFNIVLEEGVPALWSIPFDRPLFADVTVGGETQSPRTPLASAPYALGLRGFRAIPNLDDFYGPSLVGGHPDNRVDPGVNGGTISGGGDATYRNLVTGDLGTVSGGAANIAGNEAVVPGGFGNRAQAANSFAAGRGSNVRSPAEAGNPSGDYGTFVWSDYQGSGVTSTGPNQFLARAEGGFGFGVNDPQAYLHVKRDDDFPAAGSVELRLDEPTSGNSTLRFRNSGDSQWDISANTNKLTFYHVDVGTTTGTLLMDLNVGGNPITTGTGAYLSAGGAWTDASSRSFKHDFEPVNPTEILDAIAKLDVQRWRYHKEPNAVHMGPVAEDFHETFGLGSDDKHIAALDGNGVALAAIQGLYTHFEQLQQENADLRRRVRELEVLVRATTTR